MYYIRDKNEKNKVNLDDFRTIFNYKNLMYKDHRESFEKALGGTLAEQAFICDLSAALLANMYATSYTHKDIIEKSLQSCEKIIQNIGYNSLHKSRFYEQIGKREGTHVLLTVGCQSQQMLKNRAEKAAQFTIDSGVNFKVIFSGNSPKENRSRIRHEFIEMEKYFLDYLEQNNATHPRTHYIEYEKDSSTTRENIIQVFNENLKDSTGEIHLYIVSSSFHLIRLSEAIEAILDDDEHKTIKSKIKSVNLIGAEAINKEFYPGDKFSYQYLRSMLFDVFRHILIVYPKKREEEKKKQDAIDTENRRLEKIESDKREKELMDKSAEI